MNAAKRPSPGQIAKIRAHVRATAYRTSSGRWKVNAVVADATDGWTMSAMYSREHLRQLNEFVAEQEGRRPLAGYNPIDLGDQNPSQSFPPEELS